MTWRAMLRRAVLASMGATLALASTAHGETKPAAPPAKAAEQATPVGVQASTPSAPAAIPTARRAPEKSSAAQAVRGDAVQIEGKLYSPQAVYLLNRTVPHFGRDAVVPHTLTIGPATELAPYRVRAAAADTARPAGR